MKVTPHSDYRRIAAAVKTVISSARPWTGTIYRSAPPKWAGSRDMLTGAGSMKSGARFNAAGSFPALYGSTTPELAMIESLAYQRRAGLPIQWSLPLVFKAISVDLEWLLDLTDPAVLSALNVILDQLRFDPWWLARARGEESLTQAIGRAAHDSGAQALFAASAQKLGHGHNIIVLPDHIHPPSALKVLRRGRR